MTKNTNVALSAAAKDQAYQIGNAKGKEDGFDDGFRKGLTRGDKEGYFDGYESGHRNFMDFINYDRETDLCFKEYRFNLFLTVKGEKDSQFAETYDHEFREEVLQKAVGVMRKSLDLSTHKCWFFGIHVDDEEIGSNRCHLAFTFGREIPKDDLVAALKKAEEFLSKGYDLDLGYRIKGETHGDVPIKSLDQMAEFFTSKFCICVDCIMYSPIKIFKSKNSWKNAPRIKDDKGRSEQLEFAY